MRFLLYIIIAACLAFEASGQGTKQASQKANKASEIFPLSVEETEETTASAIEAEPDVFPQLNGGPTDFLHYVGNNMRYPEVALQENIEGKVMVLATVGADGKVQDASILQGLHPSIDAEALRLVKDMPAWHPAEKNGKPVATRAVVMVPFTINKNQEAFK